MVLDGDWSVRRRSGLLPPLYGVRKRFDGDRGWTMVGPLRVPFDMSGAELRYRGLFRGFVDVLTALDADTYSGRATFRGKTFGSFTITRRE